MKDREYWKKRFQLLEESQNKQGRQCYENIERQYRQAQREIETKLQSWYQRFANNNYISMPEARKLLVGRELDEFKWDVNEYIRYGELNKKNGMWAHQLENASARYHISRFEAIKIQLQQSLETMFGNQLDSIDYTMRNVYTKGYYGTAFEIQKGIGVGWDFAALDERKIKKVINEPWAADGKNFSERVWGNRQKLVNELNTELTKNIILGEDPQKAIDAIAKKMKTSKSNAGRLVMTEQAFFGNAAQKDCFEELGVEEYEIVATLDSLTSETCCNMDGRHFPMSEWETGATAPPFHVGCRTATAPYFDDEFDVGERAARDEDGKTYYVPANMTYREWEKKAVKGQATKNNSTELTQPQNDSTMTEEGDNMSLEYQRYGRNKETLINNGYIDSGEYRKKFDKITDNAEVNRTLYSKAKEMLKHRSGTMLEDMHWIDGATGKVVASALDEKLESRIVYTDAIRKAIKDKSGLITLHTHPSSMPPSISDFNANVRYDYDLSLVICHDGTVYAYNSKEEISVKLYSIYVEEFINKGHTEKEAQLKALEEIRRNYEIDFWEVK